MATRSAATLSFYRPELRAENKSLHCLAGANGSAQSTILHSDPEGGNGQKIGTIDCAEVREAADGQINLRM